MNLEEISSCTGKFGFENYSDALKAIRPKKQLIKGRTLKIYQCKFCKLYHLGSGANVRREE